MFDIIQTSRSCVMQIIRGIKTNRILRDEKPITTSSAVNGGSQKHMNPGYSPSKWEKYFLVWMKNYPNEESIPPKISFDLMQRTMSRVRVRLANYMIVFALMGCAGIIISSKFRVKGVIKDTETEHENYRRSMTAEYKAALEAEASKK